MPKQDVVWHGVSGRAEAVKAASDGCHHLSLECVLGCGLMLRRSVGFV